MAILQYYDYYYQGKEQVINVQKFKSDFFTPELTSPDHGIEITKGQFDFSSFQGQQKAQSEGVLSEMVHHNFRTGVPSGALEGF